MSNEIKMSRLVFTTVVISPIVYFPTLLVPAMIAGFIGWILYSLFIENRNELLAILSLIASIGIYAGYFKPDVGAAESLGLIIYSFFSGVSMLYFVYKALGIKTSKKEKPN
jgi:hypothetical protein